MYDLGEGVAPDPKRALVYYKEAAVKGDRDAQFALGTFFYAGEMVPKDLATARKLFDAAARQGQADAMFNLGAMTAAGEGGPKDLAQAYVWFSLADAAGYQGAQAALKSVAPLLSAQEHARAEAILRPGARKAG
jgi:TPR repeat protein